VLTEDGSVAPRPITTANDIDKNVVVTSGLKAGDKVVVDNITKLFMLPPKSKVKPTVVTLEQFNANPAPAAPTAPEGQKPAAEGAAKPEGKPEEQPAAK
jgi:membrane fusion protein (multidrug efflux system)